MIQKKKYKIHITQNYKYNLEKNKEKQLEYTQDLYTGKHLQDKSEKSRNYG